MYKAGNWKELWTNSQGLMLELSSGEFGSWRERDPLGYHNLYILFEMRFRAKESTQLQLMGLGKGAERRNVSEEFLALQRAKVPCPNLSVAIGFREGINPELTFSGGLYNTFQCKLRVDSHILS